MISNSYYTNETLFVLLKKILHQSENIDLLTEIEERFLDLLEENEKLKNKIKNQGLEIMYLEDGKVNIPVNNDNVTLLTQELIDKIDDGKIKIEYEDTSECYVFFYKNKAAAISKLDNSIYLVIDGIIIPDRKILYLLYDKVISTFFKDFWKGEKDE